MIEKVIHLHYKTDMSIFVKIKLALGDAEQIAMKLTMQQKYCPVGDAEQTRWFRLIISQDKNMEEQHGN